MSNHVRWILEVLVLEINQPSLQRILSICRASIQPLFTFKSVNFTCETTGSNHSGDEFVDDKLLMNQYVGVGFETCSGGGG